MSNTATTPPNSVLAHVVLGGSLSSKPAATQALAFILKSSTYIADSFLGMLRNANSKFEEFKPVRIQAELGHGDSRPDLTIYDSDSDSYIFIENKFWAGLTEAQPVSYLKVEKPPSALVFIVPEQRIHTVWNELKARCDEAKLEQKDGADNGSVIWAEVDGKTMLITSWKYVLKGLLDAAHSGGYDAIRRDILQLQGLTNQMDTEAFLPLRADEVTDQGIARRQINYVDLVYDITVKLKNEKIADTEGRASNSYYTAGRNLRVLGKFESWFGVDLKVWRANGITPLWWHVDCNEQLSGIAGHSKEICRLLDNVKEPDPNDRWLYIPIRLKTGVERDRVIDDAVTQMTQIADSLLKAFPAFPAFPDN